MTALDWALLITACLAFGALMLPRLRTSRLWEATVTPLASIIGSGFLIIAPLLGYLVGGYAYLAMAFLVVLAYLIGATIRYNILNEERLYEGGADCWINRLEDAAAFFLAIAYLISVAFYLRLLSAFLFEAVGGRSLLGENLLTTVLLLSIGLVGLFRGLNGMELLEKYSVSVKMAIIAALLLGLVVYNFNVRDTLALAGLEPGAVEWNFDLLRYLAGFVLVVQGFETSKYLGEKYTAQERVRSMRIAQIVAGVVYVVFVWLARPLLVGLNHEHINETAIIDLTRQVALVLPTLLIVGAVMSQFSAGVADTVGAGELLSYTSRHRFPARWGFLAVALASIALVWSANVLEIITYASRAFALYYLTQALVAVRTAYRLHQWRKLSLYGLVTAGLVFVVFFAIPVEG